MTAKKIIGKIHLWLGLITGLIVLILGITGCILVFEEEIRWLNGTSRIYKTVERQNAPVMPPSQVMKKAKEALPSEMASVYSIFKKQENAAVITWHWSPDPNDPGGHGQYMAITQNPYTGEVLTIEDWNHDFWGTMFHLHTNLLLPYNFGHHITSYSTLIFVIMMISGIILWYPKSKKGLKQRFSVKWGASPKRLNYDLHNVFGFYMTWVAIFIALTGLMFGISWFREAVYFTTSGGEKLDFNNYPQSTAPADSLLLVDKQDALIDSLVAVSISKEPDLFEYMVNYPEQPADLINVSVSTNCGKTYYRHNEFAFDRYTGQLLAEEFWNDHHAGERIMHLNYAIHLGHIGGLPTKILAFLASLIATSLPVTGFMIWWGRRNKDEASNSQQIKARLKPPRPKLKPVIPNTVIEEASQEL